MYFALKKKEIGKESNVGPPSLWSKRNCGSMYCNQPQNLLNIQNMYPWTASGRGEDPASWKRYYRKWHKINTYMRMLLKKGKIPLCQKKWLLLSQSSIWKLISVLWWWWRVSSKATHRGWNVVVAALSTTQFCFEPAREPSTLAKKSLVSSDFHIIPRLKSLDFKEQRLKFCCCGTQFCLEAARSLAHWLNNCQNVLTLHFFRLKREGRKINRLGAEFWRKI